jgi:hypothetical protein
MTLPDMPRDARAKALQCRSDQRRRSSAPRLRRSSPRGVAERRAVPVTEVAERRDLAINAS